jgi:hypothetical protein
VGKLGGKSPLGRYRLWWADNIKMDLRERGWDVMDLIDLLRIGTSGQAGCINCCEFLE